MRIFKWQEKLVEEVGRSMESVVFFRPIKEEDKDKCPHCGKPVPTEFAMVENSPNFQNDAKPVETLTPHINNQ